MQIVKVLWVLVFLSLPFWAYAHSQLDRMNPDRGAVLSQEPESIDLSFLGEIRLTKVTLQRDEKAPKVLDVSGYREFAREFSFSYEEGGKGRYKVEWRGLGTDGHVMQGSFSFTVE